MSHLFYADDLFFKASTRDCRSIKRTLDYEKTSRQTLNYEKSLFMTSPNTSSASKDNISNTLKVKHMESLGWYFGLSSQNTRNKEVFSNIKERVWKALQGWKENFLQQLEGKYSLNLWPSPSQTMSWVVLNFWNLYVTRSTLFLLVFGGAWWRMEIKYIGETGKGCASTRWRANWDFETFILLTKLCWPNRVGGW